MYSALRLVAWFVLFIILTVPGAVRAAEKPAAKFDPAAAAKTVAPFIDEQTVAVVRADLTRVDLRPLFERVVEWAPETRTEIGVASLVVHGALGTLTKAGVREAYVVVSLADIPMTPPHQPPLLIFPIREGADEKALATLFAPVREYEVKQRVGNVFFVGGRAALDRYQKGRPDERPELAAAFAAAGDTSVQTLLLPPKYTRRVIEEMMPELPAILGGGSSRVLTDGFLWGAVGVDLSKEMSLRVVVQSKDKEAATAAKAKWNDACRAVRKEAEKEGALDVFDTVVALLVPDVQDDRLVLVLDQKNQGINKLLAAVKPVIEKGRDEARRSISGNRLQQIGLAMHVYHEAHKAFPPAAVCDAAGKPLLSWRVQILPQLGEQKLYDEFRLHEPWDSEHNRPLIERMPAVYASPESKVKEEGRTVYLIPLGKDTWFSTRGGAASKDVKTADRAILVVEADGEHAVVWTKPEDLAFDPENPRKGFAGAADGRFLALFFDGHVERVDKKTDAKTLRGMFTREAK
jgi:prepilin-type processing-associated H-X9-DG protein